MKYFLTFVEVILKVSLNENDLKRIMKIFNVKYPISPPDRTGRE